MQLAKHRRKRLGTAGASWNRRDRGLCQCRTCGFVPMSRLCVCVYRKWPDEVAPRCQVPLCAAVTRGHQFGIRARARVCGRRAAASRWRFGARDPAYGALCGAANSVCLCVYVELKWVSGHIVASKSLELDLESTMQRLCSGRVSLHASVRRSRIASQTYLCGAHMS